MEPINVNLSCDLQHPVKVQYLDGYFFSKDSAGHRINVDVFDNGVPVSVGGSISADVIRSDGETVPVTGAVSGNRAYVILPAAAYAIVGAVQITIKVTEGTTIVTIASFVAYVHESDTDITVDPGTIIPSIQALISQIETAVASIPADYSSLWTSLAPAFSTSTAYAVGQYVTNSGVLYRFTTAHPAGTWNSAHVTAVNLGSDISALKSALSVTDARIDEIPTEENTVDLSPTSGYMKIDGSIDSTSYYKAAITVKKGEKYKLKCQTGVNIRAYVLKDSNSSVVDYYETQDTWATNHNYDITVTIIADGTLYINSILNTYIGAKKVDFAIPDKDTFDSMEEDIESFDIQKSYNLYKGNYADGYVNYDGSIVIDTAGKYAHMTPTLLKAGSYLFVSARGAVSSNAERWFKYNSNGVFQTYGNCTVLEEVSSNPKRNLCQFTLDEDSYISLNLGYQSAQYAPLDMNSFMLVTGSTAQDYPQFQKYFAPYSETVRKEINGLTGLLGKTAIFDGDSICNGTSVGSSDPSYGLGYAGRIGNANQMTWKNYGINGGVISSASTSGMSGKHSVFDNLSTMHTQYPNADYIIIEGGTNDADTIGDAISDPSIMGTLNLTDYSGSYNTGTFTGALETIFYNAIGYWKGKKIGYIVAQKMGYGYSNFDKDHANRRTYFERAMQVCEKWGIPYLNLWDGCYLNPRNANLYDNAKTADQNIAAGNLYTDGQHLTAAGYDYISPIIAEWMKSL